MYLFFISFAFGPKLSYGVKITRISVPFFKSPIFMSGKKLLLIKIHKIKLRNIYLLNTSKNIYRTLSSIPTITHFKNKLHYSFFFHLLRVPISKV